MPGRASMRVSKDGRESERASTSVNAVALAVRGSPSRSAISPKTSPSVACANESSRPSLDRIESRTRPLRTRKRSRGASSRRKITCPAVKAAGRIQKATASRSSALSGAKKTVLASSSPAVSWGLRTLSSARRALRRSRRPRTDGAAAFRSRRLASAFTFLIYIIVRACLEDLELFCRAALAGGDWRRRRTILLLLLADAPWTARTVRTRASGRRTQREPQARRTGYSAAPSADIGHHPFLIRRHPFSESRRRSRQS